MEINRQLEPEDLAEKMNRFWEYSGQKIQLMEEEYDTSQGSPVFTVEGKYTTRAWTDWTQGFQYGGAVIQYDATDDEEFLDIGRNETVRHMPPHVADFGVHDHGFNNISTFGNLRRLMLEDRIPFNEWEHEYYNTALKISGTVQARRWTPIANGDGFIYSFNGPHSLFVDTVRSCRSLALAHFLGYYLPDQTGRKISLLKRLIGHLRATANYSVYYGEGRDAYDVWGRTVHEAIFNVEDGRYRCPNTQQGYSPFSTWTRGLAWAMSGFPEQLEFLRELDDEEFEEYGGRESVESVLLKAAKATCDFYIENTASDGIPYWDTGAPTLHRLGDWKREPADPFNPYEPVDSSAAAIGAQGLLRLGRYLRKHGDREAGNTYFQAGLTVLDTLLDEPYLSTDDSHQGLILHAIYHRPNGWDHIPEDETIPCGESCMWGDYHAREVVLYLQRLLSSRPYYTFYGPVEEEAE